MSFELHSEKKIGYKRLSDADLGQSEASRQTHIGLSQSVFAYLPDKCEQDDCMLLYEDSVVHLPFYFDRILRQNGKNNPQNSCYTSNNHKLVFDLVWS